MAPFVPFFIQHYLNCRIKEKVWAEWWLALQVASQSHSPSKTIPKLPPKALIQMFNKMQGASQKLHAFYMFTSDDRTTWRSSLLLARILAAGKSDTKNARGRPSKVELIITNDNCHQKYSYTMERAAVGFGWLLSLYIVLLQLWMTAWVWCNTIATSAFPLSSTTEPCFF